MQSIFVALFGITTHFPPNQRKRKRGRERGRDRERKILKTFLTEIQISLFSDKAIDKQNISWKCTIRAFLGWNFNASINASSYISPPGVV